MKKYIILTFFIFFSCLEIYSQTIENAGWLFLSHTQKLSSKFDFLTDVQLRSADKFSNVNTLLLRSAFNYNFNKVHSAALGYAYKGDWMQEEGGKTYEFENRIYQQYLADLKIQKVEVNARFRFEQRFIEQEGKIDFSQRARVFFSAKIPLVADTGFEKGLFTNLQNEIFLNVHHRDRVNGSLFDQNRSLISFGYRWSKKIDTELGYMLWYQKDKDENFRDNIFQLMITTSL